MPKDYQTNVSGSSRPQPAIRDYRPFDVGLQVLSRRNCIDYMEYFMNIGALFGRLCAAACTACFLFLAGPAWSEETNWSQSVSIYTAAPGGSYHVYGAALAKILTRELGRSFAEQITEGAIQNVQLIESGTSQMGLVTMGAALQGWNGTESWTKGRPFRSLRVLFPMYDTPFTFVVLKETGIRSVSDMQGKRIGVGPRGGTAGSYIPKFLKTLGVEANLVFGTYAELSTQLEMGNIDMLAAAAGSPYPALATLEAKKMVSFIGLSKAQIIALRLAMPELTPSTVHASAYPSLAGDYATVGLFNFAVANSDMPDSLAYSIVDAVFKNREELIQAHPAASETIPANFSRNTFMPYHPGANRYFNKIMTRETVQGD